MLRGLCLKRTQIYRCGLFGASAAKHQTGTQQENAGTENQRELQAGEGKDPTIDFFAGGRH